MKNFSRLPARFLLNGIAVFLLCFFRVLRPLVRVRVCRLQSGRIGYLSINSELYFRLSRGERTCNADIFVAEELGELCNYTLLGMIRRKLLATRRGICVTTRLATRVCESMSRISPGSDVWFRLPHPVGYVNELNTVSPQLTFTDAEERRGKQILAHMGVAPEAFFVCLHSRDRAYLERVHRYQSPEEWSYHNHRNSDIRNYLPAARYLASIGIYGIRMGYMVEHEIDEGPMVIDYATHYRSDFGDLYLPAKCKFFLGSEGGLSSVPWTFNVPVAYANVILGHVGFRGPDLYIPKKLWWKEKRRFLKFRETLAWGADVWGSSKQFEDAGLEVLENSSDEILALAKEMNARLDGGWVETDEDEELQKRYLATFPSGHRCLHDFASRMGSEFLCQNRELLD